MSEHLWNKRIYYSDTDAEGIIYHAAYVDIAEHARTEMLRDRMNGLSYDKIAEEGAIFVLKSISLDYKRPGHLSDIITVRTRLRELKTVYCIFEQLVEKDGVVLAEIVTKITFVSPKTMRPVPCPEKVAEALRRFKEE